MKSEHRHELQTNELGRVADKVAHDMGSFVELYGNRIAIGICVVALIAAGIIYKVRTDRASETAAWRDLSASRKPDEFKDVWEQHPGTLAALWARVHEGESRLSEGVQSAFTNVESANKQLKEAREALQSVLEQKNAPPEIRERAQFALARALEAASDGSEGDAVKAYEAFRREFPTSIYLKDVESRIVALNSGSGQEFYGWFAKYERPKASDKRPHDRVGSDPSLDTGDLINDLRMQNPGADADSADEGESPAADKTDATPEDPVAGSGDAEKPDGEKPDTAAPADAVKEEAPATEGSAQENAPGEKPEQPESP